MRAFLLLSICLLAGSGCRLEVAEVADGWVPLSSLGELGCALPHDMGDMSPPPACSAAKGLPGTNLLCVDFAPIPDQSLMNPPPSQLAGWDFGNPPNCWEIKNGKLQIKDFKDLMTSCSFLTKTISSADYQKYNAFTLSVIQTLNVNKMQQTAFIYLGSDVDSQQIALNTGVNPRQRNIYEIAKSALPNGGTNAYRPLFKITSTFGPGTGYQGWQIESIAINAQMIGE